MAQQQNKPQTQQDLNQLLKVRREKLAALQEAGNDPFEITKYDQTHHSDEVKELYTAHEPGSSCGRSSTQHKGWPTGSFPRKCFGPFHRPPYCLRQQGPTPAEHLLRKLPAVLLIQLFL